jgi:pyridoxine 4-dehydrogenase
VAPARGLAEKKGVSPSQFALAWLLRRSPVMLPIPGTANVSHLEDSVVAAEIKLTDEEFSQLDAISG